MKSTENCKSTFNNADNQKPTVQESSDTKIDDDNKRNKDSLLIVEQKQV